jgi:hypothetical protein
LVCQKDYAQKTHVRVSDEHEEGIMATAAGREGRRRREKIRWKSIKPILSLLLFLIYLLSIFRKNEKKNNPCFWVTFQ